MGTERVPPPTTPWTWSSDPPSPRPTLSPTPSPSPDSGREADASQEAQLGRQECVQLSADRGPWAAALGPAPAGGGQTWCLCLLLCPPPPTGGMGVSAPWGLLGGACCKAMKGCPGWGRGACQGVRAPGALWLHIWVNRVLHTGRVWVGTSPALSDLGGWRVQLRAGKGPQGWGPGWSSGPRTLPPACCLRRWPGHLPQPP